MNLDIFKDIPLIQGVSISNESGLVMMTIGEHPARGYFCNLYLILTILIKDSDKTSIETLRYITLLLGGCTEIPDYSLQLTPEGLWLCGVYSKDSTSDMFVMEIEKQLALTRYLHNIISRRCQLRTDAQYENA